MKIIGSRSTGKTSELIRCSNETGTPILVKTEREKKHILEKMSTLGISNPLPVVIREAKDGEHVLVDELDKTFEKVLNVKVEGFTLTIDD